ncbi:DUF2935 domain-containing protein [Bacillus sp. REN3]|uniref:DUF2935 domain-containing protein n=1 Tax=Bacillus sp. REN3 TaxID=2802440 RepID=UPI001AEF2184|nr:DUF2935 domain-containing protein [Bacillus sp. REN3]
MNDGFNESSLFEHRFWLQVLGDHARCIKGALESVEKEDLSTAQSFIENFDHLLSTIGSTDLVELSFLADEEARKIRQFKLNLIAKMLTGKVEIHFGPTFVNHMVNEVEEYIRVLQYLKKKQKPPVFHELHHHSIWLLDAAGHAGAISSNLDQTEKKLKEKSDAYLKQFEDFYLKAVEMTGYLRTNLATFPAIQRMNSEVSLEIRLFMKFLDELKEMEMAEMALGSFAPLMADHMFREECYYLTKVAEATEMEMKKCDPGKPRVLP